MTTTDDAQTTRPSGLHPEGFDQAVRPQDDLYGFATGGWRATTAIPAEYARWGAFHVLHERALADVRAICDEAEDPLVGALWDSFMDTATIESLGASPLDEVFASIDGLGTHEDFFALLGRLQRQGVPGLFAMYVNTDAGQSDRYLPYVEQAGLGLPDESWYRDEQFAPIREAYVAHVATMLDLVGRPATQDVATRVMAFETAIAQVHWDNVACRDAVATYNALPLRDLVALAPDLDLAAWARGLGATDEHLATVVVRQPSFLSGLSALVAATDVATLRDWLTWHVVADAAPLLHDDVVQADFDFSGRMLTGAEELRARWKRAVALVSAALGEAVGARYVQRHFPPRARARMMELVDDLVAAYRASIQSLEWMTPTTRQRALDKLDAFTPKIGHPTSWRDYSALELDPSDLVGNLRAAAAFETDRQLAKLGGPVDRDEWFMNAHDVNAYYNPGMNEIVFPAAILQPPFFDVDADDAVNYGAIGAVIGHEIGHGFDDQGSRYDGQGNLVDWWTEEDRAAFESRAQQLVAQYDVLSPRDLGDEHTVNGALTVGENIGDLGGIQIALAAYEVSLEGADAPVMDGWTGRQRAFLAWAWVWAMLEREQEAIRLLSIDPHSPAEFRANIVGNLREFHEAFDVQPGDGMWVEPDDRVRIW